MVLSFHSAKGVGKVSLLSAFSARELFSKARRSVAAASPQRCRRGDVVFATVSGEKNLCSASLEVERASAAKAKQLRPKRAVRKTFHLPNALNLDSPSCLGCLLALAANRLGQHPVPKSHVLQQFVRISNALDGSRALHNLQDLVQTSKQVDARVRISRSFTWW